MNEKDIREIESNDFDVLESVLVSLREVWRRKVIIILVAIVGLLFGIIFVSLKGNEVRYYSSTTLYSAVYGSTSESNDGVAVMNRYVDLLRSTRVCGKAAKMLSEYNISTEMLQSMVTSGMISMSSTSTSSMQYAYQVRISVTSDNPEIILPVTNAISSAYASELNDLLGTNAIQIMDEATKYSQYNTTNVQLYLAAFPVAFLAVAIGIVFVIAFLSPYAKSVAQCEQKTDLVLGMLPYIK